METTCSSPALQMMATIEEPHVLLSFENIKKGFNGFLPVSEVPTRDVILATTGNNTVELIESGAQRSFKSWSTKSTQPFTCPAVYNSQTDCLVTLQQEKILRQWKPDEDSMDNSSKIKLANSARCLLAPPCTEPMIVFMDGRIEAISHCLEGTESKNQKCLESDDSIIWASAAYKDTVNVALLVQNTQNADIDLCFTTISASTNETISFHKKNLVHTRKTALVACSLHKDGTSVLTLWSNGEVQKHTANSEMLVLQLPKENKWLGIETVNRTHIAIAGVHSSNSEHVLEIWDFKFGVKKASRVISFTLPEENCRMKMLDERLYVECENKILQVPISVEESSLAVAIGKLCHQSKSPVKRNELSWGPEGLVTVPKKSSISSTSHTEHLNGDTPSLCREVFTTLREKGDLVGIIDAIHNLNDISEPEIAELVRYMVGLEDKAFETLDISFEEPDANSVISKRAFCLGIVLSIPYNDAFIHNSLKKLSIEETLILLQHLNTFLAENEANVQQRYNKLTVPKAVGWINLLLDSHFTELILTNDANIKGVLSDIHQIATSCLNLYEDMEDLNQLIHVMINKIQLPKENNVGLYSMEILCI